MTTHFRKFVLTAHLTFSIGWLGAVAVFLVHAITGLNTEQPHIARATYTAMELSAWLVIVPACFGALLTGVVQSLGTPWGLFKYYWIVVKLLLTVIISILLLLHLQPISDMAQLALNTTSRNSEHQGLQMQLVIQSAAAFFVLLGITAISVYKPWDLTTYGLRKQTKRSTDSKQTSKKALGFYVIVGIIVLVLVIIIVHLLGGGLSGH